MYPISGFSNEEMEKALAWLIDKAARLSFDPIHQGGNHSTTPTDGRRLVHCLHLAVAREKVFEWWWCGEVDLVLLFCGPNGGS